MKRCLIFSVVLLWALVSPKFSVPAQGATPPQIQGETLFNDTAAAMMEEDFSLSPIGIIKSLWKEVTKQIKSEAHFVMAIVLIAVTSAATNVLSNSFGDKASGEAAFFAAFAMMSALALKCFSIALEYTQSVVFMMCTFINKLSPLVVLSIALCGKCVTAAAFEPMLSGAVYVVSLLIEKALVPLGVFGAMLSVSSNISEGVRLSGFTRVINSFSKWLMAATITIFTGVNAIYGINAPALDAMSAKAAKFAIGTMVPVVGSFLSDTMETVISGARLMKNVTGTAGVVAVVGICAIPIIKLGIILFMLKISAALCEPIADKRIYLMLSQISSAVTTLFAIVIMVAVLFIINIAMIVSMT